MLRWPRREEALDAARAWATDLRRRDPSVLQVLCIGSAARGDWGVGSDLDLIVILSKSAHAFGERYRVYYPDEMPAPVDLWVYTQAEWDRLAIDRPGLFRRLKSEMLVLA